MKKIKNKLGYAYRQAGFSLIELLVVISIIGVLTAVLMINFVGARERSRDAQKIQDLNSLKNAMRMYYNDNQTYPGSKAIILGSGFTSYAVAIGDTGFSYVLLDNGNGFVIRTSLESGAGDEDTESQLRCGLTPTPRVYAVCAN